MTHLKLDDKFGNKSNILINKINFQIYEIQKGKLAIDKERKIPLDIENKKLIN